MSSTWCPSNSTVPIVFCGKRNSFPPYVACVFLVMSTGPSSACQNTMLFPPQRMLLRLLFQLHQQKLYLIMSMQRVKNKIQLILGWLLSSLTKSVLVRVISCMTSHSVWSTLQTLFVVSSDRRIHDLKHDESNITKGSLSMADCIKKVKSLLDSLTAVDLPMILLSSMFTQN